MTDGRTDEDGRTDRMAYSRQLDVFGQIDNHVCLNCERYFFFFKFSELEILEVNVDC